MPPRTRQKRGRCLSSAEEEGGKAKKSATCSEEPGQKRPARMAAETVGGGEQDGEGDAGRHDSEIFAKLDPGLLDCIICSKPPRSQMARTMQTARKSTGGRVPRGPLAPSRLYPSTNFLDRSGMPSLLWEVLRDAGYAEGQQPVYFWNELRWAEMGLARVRVVVPPLPGVPDWAGWKYEADGRNPEGAANRVAMMVIRDIMARFPQQFAAVVARTFPIGDPLEQDGKQPQVQGAIGGNAAMGAMSATLGVYDQLEQTFFKVIEMHEEEQDKAYQKEKKLNKAIKRLQNQLDDMKAQRDEAIEEKEKAQKEVQELEENADSDKDLIDMLARQRNEALDEKSRMEDRVHQVELANDTIREAYYAQHYRVDPYAPGPSTAQYDAAEAVDEEVSSNFYTEEDAFVDEPQFYAPPKDDE